MMIDAELGEAAFDNEEQIAKEIAARIAATIRQGQRPALRGAHAKAHACVRAEFRVDDDPPPELAQGIFIPGKRYEAVIRFSNAAAQMQPDIQGDARGMAIKLHGVGGEKILDRDKDNRSADFLMINSPVFFVNDPAKYLKFLAASGSGCPFDGIARLTRLGWRGALTAARIGSSKIASPLSTRYWSAVPYRLGDTPAKQAIKFSARPCAGTIDFASCEGYRPNFLRDAMDARLSLGDVYFDFEVQPRRQWMSVEDSVTEWKEADAPFVKIATIRIPRQRAGELNAAGERLSFNPWRTLPQHRPLGAINRVRRVVYEASAEARHRLNGGPQPLPTSL